MAKPAEQLLKNRTHTYTNPVTEEHEYIFSVVTDKRYDGIVEMVKQEGCRWTTDGKWIIDEFGEIRSERDYREVMEVIAC